MKDSKKVATFLWILCVVLLTVFDAAVGLYKQFHATADQSQYTVISQTAVGFVFLPLLFLTRYYTKRAQMKKLLFLASALIVYFALWFVATLIKLTIGA